MIYPVVPFSVTLKLDLKATGLLQMSSTYRLRSLRAICLR